MHVCMCECLWVCISVYACARVFAHPICTSRSVFKYTVMHIRMCAIQKVVQSFKASMCAHVCMWDTMQVAVLQCHANISHSLHPHTSCILCKSDAKPSYP